VMAKFQVECVFDGFSEEESTSEQDEVFNDSAYLISDASKELFCEISGHDFNEKRIRELLHVEDCDIDAKNAKGDSLLYCACQSATMPTGKVQLLLDFGASIENPQMMHPLVIFGRCPYPCFRLLLSHISLRAYASKPTDWEHWMFEFRLFAWCHRKEKERIRVSFRLRMEARRKKKETPVEAYISTVNDRATKFRSVEKVIPLQDDISHRIVEFVFGVQSTVIPTPQTLHEGWRIRLKASNERIYTGHKNDT